MPITVQFATNRVLTGPADDVRSYGNGLVPPSAVDRLTYGTAFVDAVDLTADTVGAITAITGVTTGGFAPDAAGDLGSAGRNLLVFVHGFDNSFENAITRAAFNREWLAGMGVAAADTSVVAFGWPSAGRLLGLPLDGPYRSDQVAAGQSGLALMTVLAALQPILEEARRQGRRTFLLAHSMGNWALQAAVESWFSHGRGDALLFDAVFLAAADEQSDTFEFRPAGRLGGLARLARHVHVLFSQADLVLGASALVNHRPRLGQDGPRNRADAGQFPPERYTMVDCTGFHDYVPLTPGSSHQYYRRSPGVRTMIAAAMGRAG